MVKLNTVNIVLSVSGMTCPNCELRIENKLKTLNGLISVKANYTKEIVSAVYDPTKVNETEVVAAVEILDYKVQSNGEHSSTPNNLKDSFKRVETVRLLGIAVIIFVILFILNNAVELDISAINPNMGYGILFVVGLVTSPHCISMCGGINLSLCISYKPKNSGKFSRLIPSIFYNTGRVISYTLVGGIVGTLGSVINISQGARGVGAVIAGTFMVLMGINMAGAFPKLRNFIPKMPKIFGNKLYSSIGKNSPLIIGLLNGLMPCSPLQSVQLYALGAGSFLSGALLMFLFSLGTVPTMFAFGAISSTLSKKFTTKMMKLSAILVIILGFFMLVMGFRARL